MTATTHLDEAQLTGRLAELIGAHGVPGAVFGILNRDHVTLAAAGVANLRTGVEVTPDTVFHLGSVGKAFTATVFMQLVDEGLIALDEPVRAHLPGFTVSDPEVSAEVTPRHLLTHTSGIDGDYLADFGRGDDALERFIDSCSGLAQVHPLGAMMSYCNIGYPILARMMEVVTGQVWDDLMHTRLFAPLGLSHTSTLPEEAIIHRRAIGHAAAAGEELDLAPAVFPRCCGPMGLTNSTVRDALRFARFHLSDGRTGSETPLLSEQAVLRMRTRQVEVPDRHTCAGWGLGWQLFDWGGPEVFGHDGGVPGMSASLRVLPEQQMAICLVSNGGDAGPAFRGMAEAALEPAGIRLPPEPVADDLAAVDLGAYAGVYERLSVRLELAARDGRLEGTSTVSGLTAALVPEPTTPVTMVPVDAEVFLASNGKSKPETAVFYDFHEGVPMYLHRGLRAFPRIP